MMNLSKVSKKNIKHFLRYNDINMHKEYSLYAGIGNIAAFLAAIYYFDYMLVPTIVFSIFSIGIIVSLIFFYKKVEECKKNICLYFGIYGMMLSISLGVLAYAFLRNQFPEYRFLIIFLLILLNSTFFVICCMQYIRKIKNDYYAVHIISRGGSFAAVGGSFGCLLGFTIGRREELFPILAGIFLTAGSVFCNTFVYYIIKYYSFSLIGEVDTGFLEKEGMKPWGN